MGQSVKVITKRADSPYVHELGLVAAELEQRYKDSKVSLQAKSLPLPMSVPSSPFHPICARTPSDASEAVKAPCMCSHNAAAETVPVEM